MTDLDEQEMDEMMAEATTRGRPWFRQAWFTKIVAPLTVLGISGLISMFLLLRSEVWTAKTKAEAAQNQAAENRGQIKQIREDQRTIENKMIDSVAGFQAELESNTESIQRMREDLREHRQSHHSN